MDKLQTTKEQLSSKIAAIEHELETKKQRNHDCKKKLLLASALEEDYLLEIEALQSNPQMVQQKNKLKQLEEQLSSQHHINNNEDFQKKKSCIEALQCQIIELKAANSTAKDNHFELKRLQENNELVLNQNLALQNEVQFLQNDLLEMQNSIDSIILENNDVNECIMNNTISVNELKENLDIKLQQLQTLKEKSRLLQEELAVLKLGLQTSKCKPLDSEKRGNSLFAEVDDSRVKTEQQVLQLQHHYEAMKRELQKKLHIKDTLRKQITSGLNDVNKRSYHMDDHREINLYRSKIKKLQQSIQHYKTKILQQVKFVGKNSSTYVVEFANSRLKSIWSELSEVRGQLNEYSRELLENCIKLQSATQEHLDKKLQVLQLKAQIKELESKILEIQLEKDTLKSDPCTYDLNSRKSIFTFEGGRMSLIESNYLERNSLLPLTKTCLSSIPSTISEEQQCNVFSTDKVQESSTSSLHKLHEASYSSPSQTNTYETKDLSLYRIELRDELSQTPDKQANVIKWMEQASSEARNDTTEFHKIEVKSDVDIESVTTHLLNLCLQENVELNTETDMNDKLNISCLPNQWSECIIQVEPNTVTESISMDVCNPSALEKDPLALSSSEVSYFTQPCINTSNTNKEPVIYNLELKQSLPNMDDIPHVDEEPVSFLQRDNKVVQTGDNSSYNHVIENADNNISVQTLSSTPTEDNFNAQSVDSLISLPLNNELVTVFSLKSVSPNSSALQTEYHSYNHDMQVKNENVSGGCVISSETDEHNHVENSSFGSDVQIEVNNFSCITIDSSSSDNAELTDECEEKLEPDESLAISSFPHRDSFSIESNWKETRKITSLTTELQLTKISNKENSLPAKYCTPTNGNDPHLFQGLKKPLSERNTTVKRGIIKPLSTEKRWRY